jgi:hypothetical protein
MYKGAIFGLEDYIYRMPTDLRHSLFDNKEFFSNVELKSWPKVHFYSRRHAGTELLRMPLNNLPLWQLSFSNIANDFFIHQLNQMRSTLYRKLKKVGEMLGIEDNFEPPINEAMKRHAEYEVSVDKQQDSQEENTLAVMHTETHQLANLRTEKR